MIPTLTTDRRTLGPFGMAHYKAFAAFAATDRSAFLAGSSTDPREVRDSCMIHLGHWIARGYDGFFATETATGTRAGRFAIWHPITLDEPELSWVLVEGFGGRSLAGEGVIAVRGWAARQGLPALASCNAAENARSVTLARGLGCTVERRHSYASGKNVDVWRHPMGAA